MRNTSFPFSKTSKLPAGAAGRAWLSTAAGADAAGEDAGTAADVAIGPPSWAAAFRLDTVASELVAPDAPVGRTAGRRTVVLVAPARGGSIRSTTSTAMSTVQARTTAPKAHPTTSNRRPGPPLTKSGLTKPGLIPSAGSGSSGFGTGMDVVSQLNRGLSGSNSAAGTPSTELHTGASIPLSIPAPAELSTGLPTTAPD